MSSSAAEAGSGGCAEDDVEAVMLAARVLVGVISESLRIAEGIVSVSQLRVLVVVATRGPLNLNGVADAVGVHPSNITRACDKLVAAGLLGRSESAADRRHLHLTLTEHGRRLIDSVMQHRRTAIARVLARMPTDERNRLAPALLSFADAAGEITDDGLWPVTTQRSTRGESNG
jgi:DNA-binding MarR family transcriptional regulator